MKPYLLPFMVDADSLLLGISLGVVGALALIVAIRNF